MNTTRITTACPCRGCARLAGVTILRAADEARFVPALTLARPYAFVTEAVRVRSAPRVGVASLERSRRRGLEVTP